MYHPNFSNKEKQKVFQKHSGKCTDCDKLLYGYWCWATNFKRPIKQFRIFEADIHHIVLVSDGGEHSLENWILLCKDCHKKRHKKIKEFKKQT